MSATKVISDQRGIAACVVARKRVASIDPRRAECQPVLVPSRDEVRVLAGIISSAGMRSEQAAPAGASEDALELLSVPSQSKIRAAERSLR